jgi:EamA domain-containing membrane protein RarD
VLLFVPALVFLLRPERNGTKFHYASAFVTFLLVWQASDADTAVFRVRRQTGHLTNLVSQYSSRRASYLAALYGEKLPQFRAIGFVLVWASLAIYTVDVLVARRRVAVCEPAPA